jgi:glycosyltransferase involved in cell wall biosynthesis
MSSSPLALSVVICAYTEERWNELLRGVESVLRQTVPAREIVVAVDHNPQLLDRARAHFEGSAVVVANDQRPGLAGARNSGARATSTPIVAFLDDDARADPDWLAQLAQAYGAASILGVGGRIEPDWPAARPRWFPQEFNWVVGCSYRGLPTTAAPVRNMIGANMSVRRDVLDALGGFSEDLGRLEETDFCIRGRQRFPEGIWRYWPGAVVTHSVTPQRATWAFFRARCYNEGVAKASMVLGTGRHAGLESERRYVRWILPTGVARECLRGLGGDPGGPARAIAIVVGLTWTTAGFIRGWLARRLSSAPAGIPRRGDTP